MVLGPKGAARTVIVVDFVESQEEPWRASYRTGGGLILVRVLGLFFGDLIQINARGPLGR